MRLLNCVFGAAILVLALCWASLTQAKPWYYCPTTHQFYPYTQSCPVPWRVVKPYDPTPLPNSPRNLLPSTKVNSDDTIYPGCAGLSVSNRYDPQCIKPAAQSPELRHAGAVTDEESQAGDTAYRTCLEQRPSATMPGSAFSFDSPAWTSYGQDWRAKCDAAERAAITQFRAEKQAAAQAQIQADRAASEHRQAVEKARAKGYELISSVKDLILDGKELSARAAKIQITGVYRKFGEGTASLYDSQADAYTDSDNKIPVLTDDAQRELRKYLLNDACQSEAGCEIEVGGHMTMCKHLFAPMANYPDQPCLNIEVEIVYRPI